jgi:hypothetical protein
MAMVIAGFLIWFMDGSPFAVDRVAGFPAFREAMKESEGEPRSISSLLAAIAFPPFIVPLNTCVSLVEASFQSKTSFFWVVLAFI